MSDKLHNNNTNFTPCKLYKILKHAQNIMQCLVFKSIFIRNKNYLD